MKTGINDAQGERWLENKTMTTHTDGLELHHPARYACHASFFGATREAFWSDDRDAVLANFAQQVARDDADFIMAFDFAVERELDLFIAEFDRPRRDAEGRPIQRTAEKVKCDADAALDAAIERLIDDELAQCGSEAP